MGVPGWEWFLPSGAPTSFNSKKSENYSQRGLTLNHASFRYRGDDAAPRFVAERPGVLLDCAVWNPRGDAHSTPAMAGIERNAQLLYVTITEFRPAEDFALRASSFETGLRPLADLFALELCERGEGR